MKHESVEIGGFVPTCPSVPKENPRKRLDVGWQLREVLMTTLPKVLFDVKEGRIIFFGSKNGQYGDGSKIDGGYLFGAVEVSPMTGKDQSGRENVMVSLHFFVRNQEQLDRLISEFCDSYVFMYDVSTGLFNIPGGSRMVYFHCPHDGGDRYISGVGEVDLEYPKSAALRPLGGMVDNGDFPPLYQSFGLSRVFDLGKATEGDVLDGESVFYLKMM